MADEMKCPKCGSGAVHHSRRRLRDGVVRFLVYSAFRCHSCGHRYFRPNGASLALVASVLVMVGLLVVVGRLVWTHYQ